MSEKSTQRIYTALANVNSELKPIAKDQQGYGYKFRGIDDVFRCINPLFKKYRIITRMENIQLKRETRVNVKGKEVTDVFFTADYYFISLEDGSEIKTSGFGEGIDSSGGDKASSMATSNSYKYVIFQVFNIATEDQKDSDQITAEENKKSDKKVEAKERGKGYRLNKNVPKSNPETDYSDDI